MGCVKGELRETCAGFSRATCLDSLASILPLHQNQINNGRVKVINRVNLLLFLDGFLILCEYIKLISMSVMSMGLLPIIRYSKVEGDRGVGTWEQWGREVTVYGRWEKRGQEMGYPRGWEPGEIGNKFHNIVQFFAIEKAHRGGKH